MPRSQDEVDAGSGTGSTEKSMPLHVERAFLKITLSRLDGRGCTSDSEVRVRAYGLINKRTPFAGGGVRQFPG